MITHKNDDLNNKLLASYKNRRLDVMTWRKSCLINKAARALKTVNHCILENIFTEY